MVPSLRLSLAVLLSVALVVPAAPTASEDLFASQTDSVWRRQDDSQITNLTRAKIASFRPYTHYASTAYCQPNTTLTWSCGSNCEANPRFVPVASGGDGVVTQFWFVGFDPDLNEAIVSHQGTDTSKIIPDLTDLDLPQTPLDPRLFPGIDFPILVHNGFAATHSRSAPDVLSAVQTTLSRNGANKVTVVGHSLGAAIALLDAVYLPLHLTNASVRAIVYGLPRVGNQAFADYVDAQTDTPITHINNMEDPVPIIPPIFLNFHHPSGEIHIQEPGIWSACPGQDNPSSQCIVGSATIVKNNETNHDGPYDGVIMGC
ncbi:lipase [Cerioporus squamosus]|nr:lipase [Cerioporus squamosus]